MWTRVLRCVPCAAAREVEHCNLHLTALDRRTAVHRKVADMTYIDPRCLMDFLREQFLQLNPFLNHVLKRPERYEFASSVCGMLLTAFRNHFDARFRIVSVHKLTEPANFFLILNG